MQDKFSVSRRALDFEDYIDIVRRNLRWIAGPTLAGLVITIVVAFLLPDTYVSHALIRIVPQQISDTLVQNVSAQDMTDRINGLAQTILSRTTLTSLIQTYGLYKRDLKSEPMEDVVNKMHSAIHIVPTMALTSMQGKALPAMEIAFQYRERYTANKVCADLVSRFMNASSADDSQVAARTFLKDEADKAKADLDRLEQQLSDYRVKHAGALPEEMQGNLQQMNAVEQRLNNLSDGATRISERRMMIDSTLRIARERMAALRSATVITSVRSERTIELDKEISDLETTVAGMKERYTADYPDLQAAQERLKALKREREQSVKATSTNASGEGNPATARERMDLQGQIEQMESQLKAVDLEEQQNKREIQTANGQLQSFQSRLSESPGSEREYSDLLRDRDTAKQKFLDLDARMHKATISMDLESRKQGETLEQIDPASLPTEPTEPKRALIIPLGAAAGLLIGIVLVAIREIKDTSLKNLKDARVYTQLSILGSIPLLENDVVVQRRKQVRLVGWAAAVVFSALIIAGSVAHYYMNRA